MKLQDEMFQLITDWKKSNLTKIEFLKDTNIRKGKFGYWLTRFNKVHKSYPPRRENTGKLIANDFKQLLFPQDSEGSQKKIFELITERGLKISVFE